MSKEEDDVVAHLAYTWFVVEDSGGLFTVHSGWEYREDAIDASKDMPQAEPGFRYRVLHRKTVGRMLATKKSKGTT